MLACRRISDRTLTEIPKGCYAIRKGKYGMDNQPPRPDVTGKLKGNPGKAKPDEASVPETKMGDGATVPNGDDPRWTDLGRSPLEGESDLPGSGPLRSPANYTELSPSRVLGKNLVKI